MTVQNHRLAVGEVIFRVAIAALIFSSCGLDLKGQLSGSPDDGMAEAGTDMRVDETDVSLDLGPDTREEIDYLIEPIEPDSWEPSDLPELADSEGDAPDAPPDVIADELLRPDWLGTWAKRMRLTIDLQDIDEELKHFTLLIHLGSAVGRSKQDVGAIFDELQDQTRRKKIAVTTQDGISQCFVEIETWEHLTREAWLWVRAPEVSASRETVLYLYYDQTQEDNSEFVNDPATGNSRLAWDANHRGVWHLGEYGRGVLEEFKDSTAGGAHGTGGSGVEMKTPMRVAAAVGYGQSFDGEDDYIETGALASALGLAGAAPRTIALWVYVERFNGGGIYSLGKQIEAAEYSLTTKLQTNHYRAQLWTPDLDFNYNSNNTWVHFAVIYTGAKLRVFADGVEIASQTMTLNTGDAISFKLGTWSDYSFYGLLDEVRVSDTARSDAWMRASYESERDDLLFFGPEEVLP